MTEEEKLKYLMNKISLALKDETLQQGFEVILKKLSELEKESEELKDLLNRSNVRLAEEQIKNEELKAQIEKMKSEINTVYLAFVYVNDCLDDVLSFGTLEKAEEYKKSKDSFNPCCVVNVNIEQHYIR